MKKKYTMEMVEDNLRETIIARLRAGDKLCEKAKKAWECGDLVALSKAIAEYEGKG